MPLFDGSGDRIWTVAEVAAELDYSEGYITKRAEAGMLPSFRCGGELLFSKAELRALVSGSEGADEIGRS